MPLIDPNFPNLMPRLHDLLLDRARTLHRLVLDNKNFRHAKTIRNRILLRNYLSPIS